MGINLDYSLVFLHGFLGQPADWNKVAEVLKPHFSEMAFVDLNNGFLKGELNFQGWPHGFQRWLKTKKLTKPIVLIGYSMGGRLALPLLEQGWASKAILISSQLGIPAQDFERRNLRRVMIEEWAEKFAHAPWDNVIASWNRQEVFQGSAKEPERTEKDYDREKLVATLNGFSIGEQKDYSFLLDRTNLSLLFVSGERDKKYVDMNQQLSRYPGIQIEIVKDSGHRVHFDQPEVLAQDILNFLK